MEKKYDEKKLFPPILAVDFDGTLVENKFPDIGPINWGIFKAVKAYQQMGWKIILWSCRNGEMLKEAAEFCAVNGLTPDAVNENLKEVQEYFGSDTRKVFANMYIDDRNAALFTGEPNTAFPEFAPFNLIVGGNPVHGA